MKLHETRKGQVVKVANHGHAKGAREWPTGGAGRPGLVAILGGPFAQVQARTALPPVRVFLENFQRSQAGRPDLSRPACFSFGIRPNFSGILCSPSSFGFAAH